MDEKIKKLMRRIKGQRTLTKRFISTYEAILPNAGPNERAYIEKVIREENENLERLERILAAGDDR